jgi:drug/metabolite transporter (DMT)-like permease
VLPFIIVKNTRVHLALILVSVLFGFGYIAGKYVLQFAPPDAWIFCRSAGAALVLVFLAGGKLWRQPSKKDWLHIGVFGLFGVVINQICFFEGLARTTPTHAAVINTSIPMFTLFFSILLGQEKLNPWRAAGMVMSVLGILVMLEIEKQHYDPLTFWGDLLTVGNSCSFSLYLALSRNMNRRVSPIIVTTGMFVFGSMALGLYGAPAAINLDWHLLPPPVLAVMLYIVLGGTVGTYYLNNWALSKVDSSAVALYIYIQPIVAAYLSRVFYHENLTLRTVLASLLVFTGAAIGNFFPLRKTQKAQRRLREIL